MVLKAMLLMMALNFPGLFGDNNIMQATAEDGQTDLYSGSRLIPGGQGAFTSYILDVQAGTFASDGSIGTVAWGNPINAQDDDAVFSNANLDGGNTVITDTSVRLVKGGAIAGDNKATGTTITVGHGYIGYGGVNDTWGLSLTAAEINNANFGVVTSLSDPGTVSEYLKATNWGFAIPTASTILGILVEIDYTRSPGAPTIGLVDHFRMTVYYIEDII